MADQDAVKRIAVLGAAGRTGRLVVEEALAKGYAVTALARDVSRIGIEHPRLRTVQGDATDVASLDRAFEGASAVVCAVGQTRGASANVLRAIAEAAPMVMRRRGVRRFVTLVGAGVRVPGDGAPSLGRRVMTGLLKSFIGEALADAQGHVDAVRATDLEWIAVRPPRLTDGARRGHLRAADYLDLGPAAQISRADLAAFLVAQVASDAFVRKAPMVAHP